MSNIPETKPQKPRKPRKPNLSAPADFSALGNLPPHNIDAERGVIGALLLDPQVYDDIVLEVNSDDFHFGANRQIFKHLIDMWNEGSGIDITLLVNRLQTAGELDAVGGQAYLLELMSSVHVITHAVYYAKIVREKSVLRQLIHLSAEQIQGAYAPDTSAKTLLGKASEQIFQLCESQTTNQVHDIKSIMFRAGETLDRKLRGDTDAIKTGFTDLDKKTDGMHPNELIILAARPGGGKTALGTNIAEYVAVTLKKTVLMVSLEMSVEELAMRLICSRGKIDNNKIRQNYISQEEQNRFTDVANELSQATMFIDDTPSRTVSEIAAVARRIKRQNGLELIIVDYLGLIEPENPNDPRQEQVAKNARRLKGLARQLHVPILCLAQLNRQAADHPARGSSAGSSTSKIPAPQLSHLRESGAIEQDADVVLFVHRPGKAEDEDDDETKRKAEIIIAKQRNGPTGKIDVIWMGEYFRFENASNRTDEPYSDFDDYGNDTGVIDTIGFDANFPPFTEQINTDVPTSF